MAVPLPTFAVGLKPLPLLLDGLRFPIVLCARGFEPDATRLTGTTGLEGALRLLPRAERVGMPDFCIMGGGELIAWVGIRDSGWGGCLFRLHTD